ncbi:nitroreductase family protein [Desulfobacterales bacterium HSG17]|nr:nitroreductase family protein [Desulfobacterales bacterium HSG17]
MDFIKIDKNLCNKDGICIATCPFLLFKKGRDDFPVTIEYAETMCIDCRHCVSVCPTGAITIKGVAADDCKPIRKDLIVSEDAIEQLIKTRRSIRAYKSKPVPQDVLNRLINIMRWAPTARNGQPVSWIVVQEKEKIHKIGAMTAQWMRETDLLPQIADAYDQGVDMILRNAPVIVVAHADAGGFNPVADCTIAITDLELAAHAFGIGGCWAGFFMRASNGYKPLVELLSLPKNHKVYGALMLGYPKYKYHRIPTRKPAEIRWW